MVAIRNFYTQVSGSLCSKPTVAVANVGPAYRRIRRLQSSWNCVGPLARRRCGFDLGLINLPQRGKRISTGHFGIPWNESPLEIRRFLCFESLEKTVLDILRSRLGGRSGTRTPDFLLVRQAL
jgi:hypothetical protein